MDSVDESLKQHGLRLTPTRRQIVEILMNHSYALSQNEIEQKLTLEADRVTVYRTLLTLIEVGLVSKILDERGQRFLLCRSDNKAKNAHFKCTDCGHIEAIENSIILPVDLPQGYVLQNHNVLITGTCPTCNEHKKT
jgi:Fur family ferric uptake transcriptional regulator